MKRNQIVVCGLLAALALALAACPNEPEHVHQWGEWDVTDPATCVAEGSQTRTCALDPSHIETELIPIDPDAHDWKPAPSARLPTCTEAGNGDQVCSRNNSHTQTGVIPALGHDSGEWHVTKTATCIAAGTRDLLCTRDQFVLQANDPIAIDDDAHEWNDAKTVTAATVTENGVTVTTCKLNQSHTKDAEFSGEYATGTAGLDYELIKSDTEYRVRKGTVTGVAAHIPAYWRPNANSPYLPVTEIGRAEDTAAIDMTDPDNPVITINGAFYGSNITALTFAPDSQLKSIGGNAFLNCTDLGNIELPASLTAIGGNAFSDCTGLTGIAIPASVTAIGSNAFNQCTYLASVTFAANSQLQTIGSNAFFSCAALTSITLPDSVTTIGANAFNQCTALVSVNIPAGVTVISNSVFQNCRNLAAITIPANATSIGDRAFQSCASLAGSITIPAGVTAIGESAFSGCSGLTAVTFAANSQLQTINSNAFSGCTGLTSIAIPASVTTIGNYAFNGNSGAEMALTSVTFAPDSQLATIGAGAFQFCPGIMIVTIPANVTTIGNSAFSSGNTSAMTLITCLAVTPPTLLGSIWVTQIKVPAASVEAYKTSTMWGTYADRISGIE